MRSRLIASNIAKLSELLGKQELAGLVGGPAQ